MSSDRSSDEIEDEIRKITAPVIGLNSDGILKCPIHGTASGIPSAFIDAMDRADKSGKSSERLHELVVEYAESVARSGCEFPKVVEIRFSEGTIEFEWE